MRTTIIWFVSTIVMVSPVSAQDTSLVGLWHITSTNATVKCANGSPYTLAMGQDHPHDHK